MLDGCSVAHPPTNLLCSGTNLPCLLPTLHLSPAHPPCQMRLSALSARRPDIPPREELPGADTAAFAGLDAYVGLMQACWAQDAQARPTFEQVVGELK